MSAPFAYCPVCGSNNFRAKGPHLLVCGQCDYHYHDNPVAAVAGFLPDENGRILLIRRAKEPSKGKLALPGGFVDIGETAEAALGRELKEELNLDLVSTEYLTSHPNEYPYRGRIVAVLDLFYIGAVRSWAGAEALAEVDSFLHLAPQEINREDLAFISMKVALEHYKTRVQRSSDPGTIRRQ
jgi:mutator protein MutT